MKPIAERLSELRHINRSVEGDITLRSKLYYHGISLWACEQQLLWEWMGRIPIRTGIGSALVLFYARFTAYTSLILFIIRMRIFRAHVLVYGIDLVDSPYKADARISGIYRFFHEKGVAYGEIFHTTFSQSFFANMFSRRRPAFYLDITYSPYSGKPFSGFSRGASDRLGAALSRPSSIAFMRRVLRLVGARAIFAIDDTRYYYPLMIAARECGIPFYAFQHGRFNSFIPGWAQYDIDPSACPFPDAVFVWSEYWRLALMRISPPAALHADRIRISGNPGIQVGEDLILTPPSNDDVTTFLIPHEEGVPESEIADFIVRILAASDTRVIYKLRRGRALPPILLQFEDTPRFESRFDLRASDWAYIDAVLGAYSTFLYEAIALGRPVGILQTSMTQASDLVELGLAETVSLSSTSSDAYRVAWTPWGVVCDRRHTFRSRASLDDTLSAIMPT